MLENIDGSTLADDNDNWQEKGKIYKFDQREFMTAPVPDVTGLSTIGWVYFPDSCIDPLTKCKIHVHFAGGGGYGIDNLGVNWNMGGYGNLAADNDMIILFPQQ